jgi:hypothetical protein
MVGPFIVYEDEIYIYSSHAIPKKWNLKSGSDSSGDNIMTRMKVRVP